LVAGGEQPDATAEKLWNGSRPKVSLSAHTHSHEFSVPLRPARQSRVSLVPACSCWSGLFLAGGGSRGLFCMHRVVCKSFGTTTMRSRVDGRKDAPLPPCGDGYARYCTTCIRELQPLCDSTMVAVPCVSLATIHGNWLRCEGGLRIASVETSQDPEWSCWELASRRAPLASQPARQAHTCGVRGTYSTVSVALTIKAAKV
jgi:hypothetical protein